MSAVSEIMTADVVTVTERMRVSELMAMLVNRHVGGAPVVDGAGRPVGMVSQSDLLWEGQERAESPGGDVPFGSLTVADVMTRGALSVRPEASVQEAARVMTANHVHRLAVVDAGGALVGVLTTYDVTRWVARRP